jgi:hypothetical protein
VLKYRIGTVHPWSEAFEFRKTRRERKRQREKEREREKAKIS